MDDYILDLNDCVEIGASICGYDDVGVMDLNNSKAGWIMREEVSSGALEEYTMKLGLISG